MDKEYIGENMTVNLRCDDTFVEDDNWKNMNVKYDSFIKENLTKNVVLLEFGVRKYKKKKCFILKYFFIKLIFANNRL